MLRDDAILITCALACFACESPAEPALIEARPNVSAWVTGAAADALSPDGHFILPTLQSPDANPIITIERAGEFTLGLIRGLQGAVTIGGGVPTLAYVEQQHGAAVDWDAVKLEDPLGYATRSPYMPLPDSSPIWLRNLFGPHYLIAVRAGRQQVALVAVAAYTAGFHVDDRGILIRPPGESGSEFRIIGVAQGALTHAPLYPEEAVEEVGTRTGARVTEVPVLTQPDRIINATGSGWKLVLAGEIVLEDASGARYRSAVVYLFADPLSGGPPRWRIASPEQPASETITYTVRSPSGPEQVVLTVDIRPDVPVAFIDVAPAH